MSGWVLGTTYILSLVAYVSALARRPHDIFRPSMWVALWIITRIGGAAAFSGATDEYGLRHGDFFSLLAILFPVMMLLWQFASPDISRITKGIYERCRRVEPKRDPYAPREKQFVVMLLAIAFVALGLYFSVVPFGSTGLVALITDPINTSVARDESFNQLSNPAVKYSFLLYANVVAPLLVAMAMLWRPRGSLLRIVRVLIVLVLILSTMLTGARSPLGDMIMVLGLVYLVRNGIYRSGKVILATVVILFFAITLLTIVREGRIEDTSWQFVMENLRGQIFDRVFVVPFTTGIETNMFAQWHGLLGISNIRPLAALLGRAYVDLPSEVGWMFYGSGIVDTNANTCFLFDYQAGFGFLGGWVFSIGVICVLDWALLLFKAASGRALVSFMAVFLLCTSKLCEAAFTTALISHGILLTLAMILVYRVFTGADKARACEAQGAGRDADVNGVGLAGKLA